jgi:hypothetical protein
MRLSQLLQIIRNIPFAIFAYIAGIFIGDKIVRNRKKQAINLDDEINSFPIHELDEGVYSRISERVNCFTKALSEDKEATLNLTVAELNELGTKRYLSTRKIPVRYNNSFKPPSFYEIIDDAIVENSMRIPAPNSVGIHREKVLIRFLNQGSEILEEITLLVIKDYTTKEFERVGAETKEISSSKLLYMILNHRRLLTNEAFGELTKKLDHVSIDANDLGTISLAKFNK